MSKNSSRDSGEKLHLKPQTLEAETLEEGDSGSTTGWLWSQGVATAPLGKTGNGKVKQRSAI